MSLQVRYLSHDDHLAYIATRNSVSFLQTPAWGEVKVEWTARSIGWFDSGILVGAGLLLLRKVPKINRYLAYLPEGPDLDWSDRENCRQALDALCAFARDKNVFQIKIGPHIWTKQWDAETIKQAISNESADVIGQIKPDRINQAAVELINSLRKSGWRQHEASGQGFGDFQPRYVYQINLEHRTEEEIFNGFNQLWRRNIRKAQAQGVTVREGVRQDLPLFHECYVETAKRDGFSPRPLAYFERMWDSMKAESDNRIRLFIAEHPEHSGAIAATTMTTVGSHAWYSYGASTTSSRELRPSNAIQWHMIKTALNDGAHIYDLRGISDTLNADNHLFGLIQFKLGTGGYAQEYVGEWDFVLSKLWSSAFNVYMARR